MHHNEILIAPSLLSCDFSQIKSEIDKVTQAGADWLHVDVMDGHFVDNITLGPPIVKSIKKNSKIPLDVHLMIEKPEKYIEAFIEAGSDLLTLHVESTQDIKAALLKIKKNIRCGITLRPKTNLNEIIPYLNLVDLVLIMTVEPGFGGQSFLSDQVQKIKTLNEIKKKNNFNFYIEVDGGINKETALICREAGANVLVAGSYVFKNDYKTAIHDLRGL